MLAWCAAACSSQPGGYGSDQKGTSARIQSRLAAADAFAELTRFAVKLPRARENGDAGFDWVSSQVVRPGLAVAEVTHGAGSVLEAAATGLHAAVALPPVADLARTISDERTGLSLDISLVGASPSPYRTTTGMVAWPGGYLGEHDAFATLTADGFEEYVVFSRKPSESRVRYRVALSTKVAGLRLMSDSVEFLDGSGTPGLRLSPPYVVDSAGTSRAARVSVVGCAYDSSPLPPWGRAVTAPGASQCTVQLDWDDANLVYPLLLDPHWIQAASIPQGVYALGCGPVSNGTDNRIVCAGGINSVGQVLKKAFISVHNPAYNNNGWSYTADMAYPAAYAGYSRFPNVFGTSIQAFVVADGYSQNTSGYYASNTVQYYYPPDGQWYPVTGGTARIVPAVAEDDWTSPFGDFLISGGWNLDALGNPQYLGSSNIFDMTEVLAGPAYPDGSSRIYHTATQCNGKVVVAGGKGLWAGHGAGVQVLPDTMTWTHSGGYVLGNTMVAPVFEHTANTTQEANGDPPSDGYYVYVAGGNIGTGVIAGIQRTNCSGQWQAYGANTGAAREAHAAFMTRAWPFQITLTTAGGDNGSGTILTSAGSVYLWDGTVHTSNLTTGRSWAGSSNDIGGGYAVVVGGFKQNGTLASDAEGWVSYP